MVDCSFLISFGLVGWLNMRLEEIYGELIFFLGGEKNDFLVLVVIKIIVDGISCWIRLSEVGRFV